VEFGDVNYEPLSPHEMSKNAIFGHLSLSCLYVGSIMSENKQYRRQLHQIFNKKLVKNGLLTVAS